jgi:hypothetical protein
VNLPLSKFRQDQLSKGAVQLLFIPAYWRRSVFCFTLDVDRHVGLETFVSNRPLRWARIAEEGQSKPPPWLQTGSRDFASNRKLKKYGSLLSA